MEPLTDEQLASFNLAVEACDDRAMTVVKSDLSRVMATIAALQAQLEAAERHNTILQDANKVALEKVEALQAEKLMLERGVSAQSALIDGLQSQLIQRTAALEAVQHERDEANSHVKFLGATKQANGSFCLDMKKYHAGHRCGRHRDDPWQGIDTEIDCFVCLKQALDAEREKVKELEQQVQDQSTSNLETMRHTDEMQSRALEAEQQLTQHTSELNEIEKIVDIDSGKTLIEKVRDLKHSFKQVYDSYQDAANEMFKAQDERTAELEAAKASQAIDLKNNNAYREQVNDLQAELERVRADNKALDEWRADVTVSLQRPGGAFFVDVPQHIKDLVKERDDLRTLIAALPKVEGAVEVSAGDDGCYILPLWIRCVTKEQADGIAALLQERQKLC